MDIYEHITTLKSSAIEQLSLLDSKKISENVLLLPFFAALGYDPFDVREVEPEFTIQMEKGWEETIDYAIHVDGSPAMLFQLKETGIDLDACDPAPLLRSLKKSRSRVGALTDGIEYRFYADLEEFYSVMTGMTASDRRPFLTFNILRYEESELEDLRRLTKSEFDADGILSLAHELKYKRLFRDYLQRQFDDPDDEFVRFLREQVHENVASKGDPGMYESPVREALQELMGTGRKAQDRDPASEQGGEEEIEGGPVEQSGGVAYEENDNSGSGEDDEGFGKLFGGD